MRTPEPSPLRAESHMQWAWGRLPKVSSSMPSPHPYFSGAPLPLLMRTGVTETGATFPRPCGLWEAAPASALPTSFPFVSLKVAKAERPISLMVPDGSTGSAQGEPSILDLRPDTEVPALVGPPLPAPEREKNKTQRSRGADLSPASKSWSWAALEAPAPTQPPEGFSRRKGE